MTSNALRPSSKTLDRACKRPRPAACLVITATVKEVARYGRRMSMVHVIWCSTRIEIEKETAECPFLNERA